MFDKVYETDVLVIGGGGAGCRAAIEATEHNVDVLILVKSLLGKSGCTTMAEGGYNAALGNVYPEDNWEVHFQDTITGGAYLNDQRLVDILVKDAPQRIWDLESFGAVFDRTSAGRIAQRAFGHQTYKRTCYASDRTGHEMMITLVEECRRRDVRVLEDCMALDLLTDDGRVVGAAAMDYVHGRFYVVKAKSTVIATGGGCRIYSITSNCQQGTGDGYAMGFRAGAELIGMEHVQFHPTSMIAPDSARGILVTEAVRGEGGYLKNSEGERFMLRYNPERKELAGRDEVTRCIYAEVAEGRGTPLGGAYLDVTHLDQDVVKVKLETMYEQFLLYGIDITSEMMQIAPTAHHFMGGVRIEPDCSTTLPGLYACAEAAGGLHGGNRLGGNALAETQVFGFIAGRSAALHARDAPRPGLPREQVDTIRERAFAPTERADGGLPTDLVSKLQKLMWDNVGIYRDRESLENAIAKIERIQAEDVPCMSVPRTDHSNQWLTALQIENMLLTSKLVAKSALFREESRGSHARLDFPEKDNENWFCNTVIIPRGVEIELRKDDVITTIDSEVPR